MLSQSVALMRTGLSLKIDQIKRATGSYLRDRAAQGQSAVSTYLLAAGLFVAAGIFLLAACFVGIDALFRWVEIRYGLFPAFGVIGGLMLLVAIVCAVIAKAILNRPGREFPGLGSRLRVAVKANPLKSGQIKREARELDEPAAHVPAKADLQGLADGRIQPAWDSRATLILAATLLGWAILRRRNLPASDD